MIKESLIENEVHRGDLVFILHRTKPMKTGWYRKSRVSNKNSTETVYVFEKPIHPNFDPNDITLTRSRKERDVFLMKNTTVSFNDNKPHLNEYEILVQATGVSAVIILQNGYTIPNSINYTGLADICITDRGVDFLSLVNVIQPFGQEASDIEKYARTINRGDNKYV